MRSKKIKTEIYWNQREIVLTFTNKNFFFLSRFSFTYTNDSQDSRVREGTIFYFTLPLPPTHEHWDIYVQLWMWGDYHVFLIATLVFTRLLLDEIYHLIELPFDWLIDDAVFVCVLDELILGFCYSDLTWKTGGFEHASTITLVLQASLLTKFASHRKNWITICDALCDLVLFIHFTKREKHSWKKPATLLKVRPLHGCFPRFLDCTNGTKLCKASDVLASIS